ncbi:helix-turn-helix domain-containing protein [Costertonia aggregata]|uniref:Helix-turn-helix transcriptional regulator n=1 Tax=Costertonia aggregata TaxID=343403 RepID=A0A7H9ASU7_9FLAO|nr:AraC family transcriptional regulator [Costertonia aggregata]QLG46543.1 helix-turn-helix transcriptional regulator [Costertonia aggregata]
MQLQHKQLNKLNHQLGGSITKVEEDRIMQCHNEKGIGRVVSIPLEAGISYTEYNLNLKEDNELVLENTTGSVLYFIYCLEGQFHYKWKNENGQRGTIEELQTVILGSKESSLKLQIPKEQAISFAVIKVDKTNTFQSESGEDVALNQQLFYQFFTVCKSERFAYHGTFNLKIKEQLLQIRTIRETGLVRKLLIKGIIHFTLALELKQYRRDREKHQGLNTRLTKKELLRVNEAIETIEHRPEYSYNIDYLCRQYGLSAAKLQEGFKVLQGCTVVNFIKKQRVELAEELIKAGELNISEIVYTIGFTSRSYFSKIFKQRFNCTPKYYQDRCKNRVMA